MDLQVALNNSHLHSFRDAVSLQALSHLSVISVMLTIFIAVFYTITCALSPKFDSQEPPVIPQKIPFIGHVLGLARFGITYYLEVSSKSLLPIYSMQMLLSKVYVVNSPELVSIVQRNTKTLSFYPFMTSWLQPLLALDNSSMEIVKHNMDSKEESSYIRESYNIHHHLLAPGTALNQMQNRAFEGLAGLINNINEPVRMNIYSWVQQIFLKFNTTAIWGPKSPFNVRPDIAKPFWNIEANFHMLLLNVFPKWTTAGAAQDRERLTQAFIEYHTTADLSEAAELMRQRVDVGKKYGLSIDALARMDIGLAQALLINTVPITTWMLLHIFSNPALLTELRIEVEQLFVRDVTESGTREGLVDFTKIKEECPLLVSTWQETLRMTSHLPSGRTVLEDTMLKDRYLLKKNATVFIFAGVLHADPKLWGPDVDKFNPRRFLKEGNQPMVHPIAFRPFGGGALLCPGRVFAFTEVLTFVATVILGFEIQSDNEVWPSLERDIYHPSLGVYKPKNAATANVVISRRVEYEDVTWDYPLQPVA